MWLKILTWIINAIYIVASFPIWFAITAWKYGLIFSDHITTFMHEDEGHKK